MDGFAVAFLFLYALGILIFSGWKGLVRFGVSLPLLILAIERLASLRIS
jgi:hypothetical protein